MMKYKALTFGAVLWDVINGNEHIGGAPYNLAAQLHQLGFDSTLVSGIGADERGKRILDVFSTQGMNADLIQTVKDNETGYVQAEINERGIPSYFIPAETAFDKTTYTEQLDAFVKSERFDLFCYGTFDQRSEENRKTLRSIWENIQAKITFYDVNLRKPFYTKTIIEESLNQADIVKINDEELIELSEMFYGKSLEEKDFFSAFSEDFSLEMIIETKGKKGCTVWDKGSISDTAIPGIETEVVVDTVGSGDAFCAGFLWSYCHDLSTGLCSRNGNLLGSHVAQSAGAVPPLSDEMKKVFNR